jgi:hypothetical protein
MDRFEEVWEAIKSACPTCGSLPNEVCGRDPEMSALSCNKRKGGLKHLAGRSKRGHGRR